MRRRDLRVSEHAVKRFQLRWCPRGASRAFARQELERIIQEGPMHRLDGSGPGGSRHYLLDRAILAVVVRADPQDQQPWLIVTILPAPEPGFRPELSPGQTRSSGNRRGPRRSRSSPT